MADNDITTNDAPKFAGIEVPPELTKNKFFLPLFEYLFCRHAHECAWVTPAGIPQRHYNSNQSFAGSINGLLMNFCLESRGTYEKIRRCNH